MGGHRHPRDEEENANLTARHVWRKSQGKENTESCDTVEQRRHSDMTALFEHLAE